MMFWLDATEETRLTSMLDRTKVGIGAKGRIQSAERAVPTLTRTTKVTNLLSA